MARLQAGRSRWRVIHPSLIRGWVGENHDRASDVRRRASACVRADTRNNNRGGLCNASGPLAADLPAHRARLRPPLGRAGGIPLHGGSPAASHEAVRLSGGWVRSRFEPLPISGGAGSLL